MMANGREHGFEGNTQRMRHVDKCRINTDIIVNCSSILLIFIVLLLTTLLILLMYL